MKSINSTLIDKLAEKVIKISGKSNKEIDRFCWMILHEYHHGVMPSEYDIREIDEEIYLPLIKRVKEIN